jgi:predicted nucleotidyltransferase component of viral defense system
MNALRPEDILHKSYMNRILIEIIDNPRLSQYLAFKGGTCAAMLGFLDRFSVDLDFDLLDKTQVAALREEFHTTFNQFGVTVAKEYDTVLFFQVKYPNENQSKRSTLKVSAHDIPVAANDYTVQYFKEIDRLMKSQTIETMFANKLVALTDRYAKHTTIAGRDLYDIHHYFVQGYKYKGAVIQERTGLHPKDYFASLISFVHKHITQTVINEDLNTLLPNDCFQQIRRILLPEIVHFLENEHQQQAHLL